MFAAVASLFAALLGFAFDKIQFTIVLWSLLFLGACLVPTASGIIISSVPKKQQNASSSLGQFTFNIFGFFLAPNISGAIMDSFDDRKEGLIWGFRFCLWWNVFSVIFLLLAMRYAS
jgi:MFS family permease